HKHTKLEKPLKRNLSQPGISSNQGFHKPTVHFDLGNGEASGQDEEWTEASNSGSPDISRSTSIGIVTDEDPKATGSSYSRKNLRETTPSQDVPSPFKLSQ